MQDAPDSPVYDESSEDAPKKDPLIIGLQYVIRLAVRALAILMTAVILWGVIDVVWVLYGRLMDEPFMLLQISDILATFGAFMAVLIAIEIFENIVIYLRDDVIHVKIVMATALMAIARKVIVLDSEKLEAVDIFAIAAVTLAMSVGYWLVCLYDKQPRTLLRGNAHRDNET
jgi:uncharacterized membrane protein (DUF373 family)